ncbi:hypothetical protein [Variovorax sp. HJSM1_2]|uniref:hypothetical protein n=1 Tax=Variovorax sp. HJSM1_2 TaxID=3366263 RepID=UPI003BE12C2E
MRYLLTSLFAALLLSACATPPGSYRFTATTQDGKPVTGSITTDPGGLSDTRTALCLQHPGATIKVVEATTGQEVAGVSPYKCP